eukprot:m.269613 g.269613  ORF g.269613 m.269613 type:complete len:217 (-) comp22822_c0_seq10:37-687(-)
MKATLIFVAALVSVGVLVAVSASPCGTAEVGLDAEGRLVLSDCFNATTLGGLLHTIQQQGTTIQQQGTTIQQQQMEGQQQGEVIRQLNSTVQQQGNTIQQQENIIQQLQGVACHINIPPQTIPTHGAVDWEWFSISGGIYLVVANQNSGSNSAVNSVIYLWSGSAFVNQQMIPTRGANDWEYFSMDGNNYLVVANRASSTNLDIGSVIYQWNGCHF